jgi:hypothetical protein
MAYFNGSEVASLFKTQHLEESSDLVHAKIIFFRFSFYVFSNVKITLVIVYFYLFKLVHNHLGCRAQRRDRRVSARNGGDAERPLLNGLLVQGRASN